MEGGLSREPGPTRCWGRKQASWFGCQWVDTYEVFDGLVEVGVVVHGLLLLAVAVVLGLVAQAVAAVRRGGRVVRRVEAVARAVQGLGLSREGGEG